MARQRPWGVVVGSLSYKVLLTKAESRVLGAILSAQGAGPMELPPGSENQKPLLQFVECGQCPTSWQHLPGGTQVTCRVLRAAGASLRLRRA